MMMVMYERRLNMTVASEHALDAVRVTGVNGVQWLHANGVRSLQRERIAPYLSGYTVCRGGASCYQTQLWCPYVHAEYNQSFLSNRGLVFKTEEALWKLDWNENLYMLLNCWFIPVCFVWWWLITSGCNFSVLFYLGVDLTSYRGVLGLAPLGRCFLFFWS